MCGQLIPTYSLELLYLKLHSGDFGYHKIRTLAILNGSCLRREETRGEEKTIPISLANKTKLEQKIGKALGLEKAAQLAVEELSVKGLLDEGGMKEKLQIMKEQANNHQTNLEELVADLVSEGLSSVTIQKTASETQQKASRIMKIYLGKDPDSF